jgi:hypothetical protein
VESHCSSAPNSGNNTPGPAAPSVAFTGGPTKGLLSSPSGTRHVSVVAQCGTDALPAPPSIPSQIEELNA